MAGGIFLILNGLFLIIWPDIVWLITEGWKSNEAAEPSLFYIWSTRFGGVVSIILGVGWMVKVFRSRKGR
ncbi:hypothetical protein GCM10008967_37810 [Bacillus carboniphilus]|uniref:DUF6199 domain-containing protein n=1 Tax=Bacillus carboniphilus TaxID=86663 RepID=A0ABP3GEU2_9BACI